MTQNTTNPSILRLRAIGAAQHYAITYRDWARQVSGKTYLEHDDALVRARQILDRAQRNRRAGRDLLARA